MRTLDGFARYAKPNMVSPGVYRAMPFDEYARIPAVSNTLIQQVHQTAAHAKWWLDGEMDDDTEYFRFGRAVHCFLLEPSSFAERFVVAPNAPRNTAAGLEETVCFIRKHAPELEAPAGFKERQAWIPEAIASLPCTVVTEADMDAIRQIARSVDANAATAKALRGATMEVTLVWVDDKTGLLCKARVDAAKGGYLIDLKSTQSAQGEAFARASASHGYHRQAAWYLWGWERVMGERRGFGFIPVEKAPPYLANFYEIDLAWLETAETQCREAMTRLSLALNDGQWTGYQPGVLIPPMWALDQMAIVQKL